jgi:hypothetical protein
MQGQGQDGGRLGPGSNPYVDPVAIEAQLSYVRAIVARFRNVPFLSFDLINEPSFSNPKRIWRGNSPNGDPAELAAWQNWLVQHYSTVDTLAQAWRTTTSDLEAFERSPAAVLLPTWSHRVQRNPRNVRAIDYNLIRAGCFYSVGQYHGSSHPQHRRTTSNYRRPG